MTFPALFAAGWAADGRDLPPADAPDGPCELCGHLGPRASWRPKRTWSAYDLHARPGTGALCLGCKLLVDGHPPGDTPSGRPPKWTTCTLATDGLSALWARKGAKPLIGEWVNTPGLSVSIADQGQKHVAFQAPASRDPASLCVALDGVAVRAPRPAWETLSAIVAIAYAAGVTKASLVSGAASHNDHRRVAAGGWSDAEVRKLESQIRPHLHTPLLALAVWLAQKPDPQEEQTA